jgi:hypothetical protein
MNRERALKVVLALLGLFFTVGAIYAITMVLWQRDQTSYPYVEEDSLYLALGCLLLTAARNPSAHRSLIAFAAWSSFARAAVTAAMLFRDARARGEWQAVVILTIIGLAVVVLNPAKQLVEGTAAADT